MNHKKANLERLANHEQRAVSSPNQAMLNFWKEKGFKQVFNKNNTPVIIESCYVLKNDKGERRYYNFTNGSYMNQPEMLHHIERQSKHDRLVEIISNYKFLGLQDNGIKQIALYNCNNCHSKISLDHLRKHYKDEKKN